MDTHTAPLVADDPTTVTSQPCTSWFDTPAFHRCGYEVSTSATMAGGNANGLSKLTCRVPFPVSPRATLTLVAKTRDSEYQTGKLIANCAPDVLLVAEKWYRATRPLWEM